MKRISVIPLSLITICVLALVFYFVFSDKKSDRSGELATYAENTNQDLPSVFNGIKKMVLIPSGKFVMGDGDSSFSDERPGHTIFVSSFYMDETPVTYADFQKYIDDGGNKTRYWAYDTYNKPENPVSGINWYHAVDYCNWRSEKEGLALAYKPSNRLDSWGYPLWELDSSANGYRLPTEAEFEYAARGGLEKKKFSWGDEFDPKYANYDDEKGLMIGEWWRLAKVKDMPANGYGLYGMSGNVWQWSNDWYSPNYYSSSPKDNPLGANTGTTKIIRGGSWGSINPDFLRVSKRSAMAPSNYNYDVGFRCVRPAIAVPENFVPRNVSNRTFYKYEVSRQNPLTMDIYSSNFVNRLGQFIADYYPNSIYFQTKIDQQEIINPQEMAQLIVDVSKEYSIHPLFLTGIIASESGFGCCSFPRWYNNPMAYHWQNVLMKNGLPLYDADRTRNRKYKNLRDAFRQFAQGIKRDLYLDVAKQDLDAFHLLYVGYRADEWMYTLSKVYKDVLGITLSPHVPSENVGRYIYVDEKIPVLKNLDPQSSQFKIIDRLLPLANSEPHSEVDTITHIVLHFSSNVITKPNNPFIPEDVISIFKQYGISAHYLITRDGTIFQLVDENRNAYHAGKGSLSDYPSYTNKLNQHSIGIELLAIGAEDEMNQYISPEIYATIPKNYIGYTDEQYAALNFLLPQIYERYDIKLDRRHIIGHDEYSVGAKRDPGNLFDWTKIGL